MGKPRKSKEEKALEAKVEAVIKTAIHGVQIDIMDLSKISVEGMRAGKVALGDSTDVTRMGVADEIRSAVEAIVLKLRKN